MVDVPAVEAPVAAAPLEDSVPAEDPELSIIVVIDEPTATIYGGSAAAPVFADLASFALSRSRAMALFRCWLRSLGAAAGGLLAKNLGKRLGADELAVKDDEMLGGAALTVGQYLSPRVYLSYGVGLFEPGEVITLRYKLSRDLSVQAQRGPEDTRAGIEFRTQR